MHTKNVSQPDEVTIDMDTDIADPWTYDGQASFDRNEAEVLRREYESEVLHAMLEDQ